jgi:hypothetical protein
MVDSVPHADLPVHLHTILRTDCRSGSHCCGHIMLAGTLSPFLSVVSFPFLFFFFTFRALGPFFCHLPPPPPFSFCLSPNIPTL